MRLLTILLAYCLPIIVWSQSWDQTYIDSLFAGRIIDPIEGVWQFPKDGAKMVIVKAKADTYDIFLLDSPRLDLRPGLPIGSAVCTARKRYYDGELKSATLGKRHKLSSQSVVFKITEDGALSIEPYKTGYSISFKRWISYLFKVSVVDNNTRPNDLNGAKRIYPYFMNDHLPVVL